MHMYILIKKLNCCKSVVIFLVIKDLPAIFLSGYEINIITKYNLALDNQVWALILSSLRKVFALEGINQEIQQTSDGTKICLLI